MGAVDPEQAIRDELAGPAGVWEPSPTSPGGWRSGVVRGGHAEQADLRTVRFLKHRASESRHLYFVTFDGTHQAFGPEILRFHYVYAVESDPDGGWRVRRSAGGAGDPPQRSTPWVNLGGGGWPDRFFAGGWISQAGAHIDRIELRFANGITVVDDCSEAAALFITDHTVAMPGVVVMLDHAGNEIASHPAFPGI